ncbi:acyloxyacyl hydrolase [Chitinophaga sp. Cy-1792]|uniref:acyloxyacyl hydrolase n=1 Tax=Chitinophaga sp. Cy-1792 TaxID=2608339 RepID=UPI00141FAC3B|nr:acyloxyacyl hydrolase [Chitinophaga sp. Cy-1792]
MKQIFVFCYLLLISTITFAQDTTNLWQTAIKDPNLGSHRYLELKLHAGIHIYEGNGNPNFQSALDNGYKSAEIRLGWQSAGKQNWQRVFNCPSYGIGFYTGNIGNPNELGYPSGLYGFFYAPFHQRPRHHFVAGLSLGVTYDLAPYDSLKNPYNDAIGSKVAVYFNADVGGVWKISDMFDIVYGVDLTHFSNGRMFMPNLGLNMLGLNVGFRYHYNAIAKIARTQIDSTYIAPRRPTCVYTPITPVHHYHELSVYGALGLVQLSSDLGIKAHYGTGSLVLDYDYRYSNFGSVGGGIDGFYDGSLGYIYKDRYGTANAGDKMLMGLHAGHAIHISRFELVTQAGVYLVQRDNEKGKWFLRIGFRYNIAKHGFVQIGLKTLNGGAADWIEWGGGGRMRFYAK